jgi:hypothetical protein
MDLEKHILDGDKYVSTARSELSKRDWFYNRIDKNKAIELMNKAGHSYALGKNYIKSSDSYFSGLNVFFNSSKILSDLDHKICEIVVSYIEMCNKSKKNIDSIIFEYLDKKIINFLQGNKKYSMIIQIYELIACNYEISSDIESTLKYYTNCLNYATMGKMTTCMIKKLKKIAELNIDVGDLTIASKKYRECSELCLTSILLKTECKLFLAYSLILEIELFNEEQFEEKLTECKNLVPVFSNSPEYNLIKGLFLATKTKNGSFINSLIRNNNLLFDASIIQILEKLKNNLCIE